MHLRRSFIEGVATGLVGKLVEPTRALGAYDRIRIRIIGRAPRVR